MLKRFILIGIGIAFFLVCFLEVDNGSLPGFQYVPEKESYTQSLSEFNSLSINAVYHIPASFYLSNYMNIGIHNYAGRTTCLMIDISDTNHLIAGSATGGLWSSYNNGSDWLPIQDQFYPMRVASISQNPFRPEYIYYSTQTDLLDSLGNQVIDLMRSTDGGLTFNYLPSSNPLNLGIRKVVCSPHDSSTIYISGHGVNNSIYRSQDNGLSFQSINLPLNGNIFDLDVFPGGEVIYSIDSGMYYSPNGNPGTFTKSNGLPSPIGDLSMDYCLTSPNICYAMVTAAPYTIIFRSSDTGRNWSARDTVTNDAFSNIIFAMPDQPDFIFFGGVSLFYSTDGGLTSGPAQNPGVDYWDIVSNPYQYSRLHIENDFGVTSITASASNSAMSQSLKFRDTTYINQQCYYGDYHPHGNAFIAGMQDLGTKFIDSANTFYSLRGGDGRSCFIHKQDPSVAYFFTSPGIDGFKRDDDIYDNSLSSQRSILNQMDGDSNGYIDDLVNLNNFKVLDHNSDVLFFPTKTRIWRSTDRGDNWTPMTNIHANLGYGVFSVSNGSDPTAYYSYQDSLGIVQHALSASPGDEVFIKTPCSIYGVTAHLENDSSILIQTNCGTLLRCQNVFAINPRFDTIPSNIGSIRDLLEDPQNDRTLIAATANGLYITLDAGQSWTSEQSIPPVRIDCLRLRQADMKLFIFTYGRGIWTADLPLITGNKEIPSKPVMKYFSVINPSNGTLKVEMIKQVPGSSLQLFSSKGKLVLEYDLQSKEYLSIDISTYSAGIYFIRLIDQNQVLQTSKLLKL